jgi:segregation and condensation protein B
MTRGEIEEIRGVAVSTNIMRSLLERDWIRVVGHRDVPGRPAMFGTTRHFLDYFGLKKLDDLPPLADLSDWETLRVQLNLPDVSEDEAQPETAEITDLPVLVLPQNDTVDEDALTEDLPILEDDAPTSAAADFEEIPATEWPEPIEVLHIVTTDDPRDEDDSTADRQDTDALISRR